MPYVQVKQKHQITIPYELRQELDLHQGDMLEAKIFQGMLVFIPKIFVSKDQALDDEAEQERRMLKAYELLATKRANPEKKNPKKLLELMGSVSQETIENGLTQEILDQIINEK